MRDRLVGAVNCARQVVVKIVVRLGTHHPGTHGAPPRAGGDVGSGRIQNRPIASSSRWTMTWDSRLTASPRGPGWSAASGGSRCDKSCCAPTRRTRPFGPVRVRVAWLLQLACRTTRQSLPDRNGLSVASGPILDRLELLEAGLESLNARERSRRYPTTADMLSGSRELRRSRLTSQR